MKTAPPIPAPPPASPAASPPLASPPVSVILFSTSLPAAKPAPAALAVVEKWRSAPQPSYELDTHNCVIFVKEIAAAVGLTVSDDERFVRDPAGFLDDVKARNAAFLMQMNTGHSQTVQAALP